MRQLTAGHRQAWRVLTLLLALSLLLLAAAPLLHAMEHRGHHHQPEDCYVCQQLHHIRRLAQGLMPLAGLLLLHLRRARALGLGRQQLCLLPLTPVSLKVKMTN